LGLDLCLLLGLCPSFDGPAFIGPSFDKEASLLVPSQCYSVLRSCSVVTYAIFSHGGRSRTWQNTWQSRSDGSPCPYSSCMQHIRQKCAIRCCRVVLWCGGRAPTRAHSAASHCSAESISTIITTLPIL